MGKAENVLVNIVKVVIAIAIIVPGISIHGWGLIAIFYIPILKTVDPNDLLGVVLLFALFYFACACSIMLIASIFIHGKVLRKMAFSLVYIYLLFCGAYILIAGSNAFDSGKMTPGETRSILYFYAAPFILAALCGLIIDTFNLFRRSGK